MFEWLIGLLIYVIVFIQSVYIRNLIFVYGIIVLWCIDLIIPKKRNYHSIELGILLLLGLANIFLNGYKINVASVIMDYLNIAIMSNGLIFLLAGTIFIKIFVERVNNEKIIFYSLPFAFLPWIMQNSGRLTLPFSLIMAVLIYFLLNKKWIYFSLFSLTTIIFSILKWKMIIYKWTCRPIVWIDMLHKIKLHPFIGKGFNKTLLPPNIMWVDYKNYGWLFEHNDYLALGMALGIIPVILIAIFLLRTYLKIYKEKISILFLMVVICCFFQSTMFNTYHATLFLTILGLSLIKGGEYVSIKKG